MTVGISPTAYQKLATLRPDFLGMSEDERQEFVESVRAKRIKPPTAEKPKKAPKTKAKETKPDELVHSAAPSEDAPDS